MALSVKLLMLLTTTVKARSSLEWVLLGTDGASEGLSFSVWRTGQSVAADVHGIHH